MATQIASLYAVIGADTSGLKKGLQNVHGELGKTGSKVKSFGDTWKTLKRTFAEVSGAAALAGVAFKTAFDFGKQGAEVAQTTASFDRLGISIEDMRKVSKDTIDDMTLMKGVLTLTAGASENLQAKLLSANPKFIAMAKAASALNPALGETAFMYDSITLAAKKSSKLIADNLGIIVDQVGANEKLAASRGKAVSALTDEEKQLAFVNGLLEAGNRLIEQNGGSVEALTDNYARMETAVKNASDGLKKDFNAVIDDAIGKMNTFILRKRILDGLLSEHTDDALEAGMGWREYADAQAVAYEGIYNTGQIMDMLGDSLYENGIVADGASLRILNYSERMKLAADNGIAFGDTLSRGEYLMGLYKIEMENTDRVISDAVISQDQYNIAIGNLPGAIQPAFEPLNNLTESAADAAIAFHDAAAGISEMSKAQLAQSMLEGLKEAGLTGQDYVDAQRTILMTYGLLTQAELDAQTSLRDLTQARIDGKFTNEQYAVQTLLTADAVAIENGKVADDKVAHQQYQDALSGTVGSLKDVATEATNTSQAIENMIAFKDIRINIDTYYKTHGDATASRAQQAADAQQGIIPGFALGGFASVGTTALVGENGPELMRVMGGGTEIIPLSGASMPSLPTMPMSGGRGGSGSGGTVNLELHFHDVKDGEQVGQMALQYLQRHGVVSRGLRQ